ncbi:MAG: hypothetical protein KIH06_04775 [Kiritimatiellae bacterium]|nr:hypothetical protein [Kiritimatiellia bacterium]
MKYSATFPVKWPVRKAWGGSKYLRENGAKYTAKHAAGKVLRRFDSKCRW